MKDLKDMDLKESADYWTGYITLEIGRGQPIRNGIALMLMHEHSKGFRAGVASVKVKKKSPR